MPWRSGPDLSLALTYNSEQVVRYQNKGICTGRWFNQGPTAGRWMLNTWPSLEEASSELYCFTTPDGAVHRRLERSYPGFEHGLDLRDEGLGGAH